MPIPKLARRFIAVALGLVAGLVLAEGCARHAGPIAGEDLYYGGVSPPPEGLTRWSATLGYEPTPGFVGVRHALDSEITVRINALGLRGGEPSRDRERWLAIGDSFVFAGQVREEDTFQAHLGARLGVEVLNAGVDGYSTVQATRRYAELDPALGTRNVIATFYLGNDLVDNARAEQLLEEAAKGPREKPTLSNRSFLHGLVHRNSYVAAYVHVAVQRHLQMTDAADTDLDLREEVSMWSDTGEQRLASLLGPTEEALRELRDVVAQNGDQLLVAVVPPAYLVDEAMLARLLDDYGLSRAPGDGPRALVTGVLSSLGVPHCDLTPGLRAAVGDRPYLRFDGHWSAAGHRVVAEEIARCLAQDPFGRPLATSEAPPDPTAAPRPRRPAGEARIPGGGRGGGRRAPLASP